MFGFHIQSRKSLVVGGWEVDGYVSVGIQSMGLDVALLRKATSFQLRSRVSWSHV